MPTYDVPHDTRVIVRGAAQGFAQEISARRHRLSADEPIPNGGTDTGPTPYDLLLAALGSCASMTVALYARRKEWPLQEVTIRLQHSRIHAADCAACETKAGRLDHIEWSLQLEGDLTAAQRARLLEIAQMCPFIAHCKRRFTSLRPSSLRPDPRREPGNRRAGRVLLTSCLDGGVDART